MTAPSSSHMVSPSLASAASSLVVGIAQLHFVVGDMAGNARKLMQAATEAQAQGVDLLVTPELALSGYAAQDLYLRPAFLARVQQALQELVQASAQWPGLQLLVGHPQVVVSADGSSQRIASAASLIAQGRIAHHCVHQLAGLPATEGDGPVLTVRGWRLGVLLGLDAWVSGPALRCARGAGDGASESGAQLLLALGASAYHQGKAQEREQMMAQRVHEAGGLPLIYAHMVGAQDELVFDGRSFALNAQGYVVCRAPGFEECMPKVALTLSEQGKAAMDTGVDVGAADAPIALVGSCHPHHDGPAELWHALVLGVRCYVEQNAFPGVLLGLSGGIDSALVLAIAVDALGPDKVHTVMMPSPYTAQISRDDAQEMAQRLGVAHSEIAIAPLFEAFGATLAPHFAGRPADTTEENLQARIRGSLLMALSNKLGQVVLTCGNKSELATGYCTLYGDMAGGFAVIKDVLKTQVFALAAWRNQHDPYGRGAAPIPQRILTRPPSAELRPDQQDSDNLPPYPVLDAIVQGYVERDEGAQALVEQGYEQAVVERVLRLIRINEYKRRQAPMGPRVSQRSFGRDWQYPVSHRFHD